MEINSIKYRNFKGLESVDIILNGNNAFIYAANGKGKTSLYDGVLWLFFGKDSRNQAQFDIKPIVDGETVHGLESSVEANITINGRSTTLKKVYKEKYTQRRGTAQSEFTGHTNEFYIDGTPKKEKDFNEFVKSICDENIFKLLTNYAYFNEIMPWQDRRSLLFDVAGGDISDADVIASDPKFKDLPAILDGKSLDDFRATLKSRRSAINKELDTIPARVDENDKKIKKGLRDEKEIETEVDAERVNLKKANEELTQLLSGGEAALKTKSLNEAQSAIIAHDNKVAEKRQEEAKKRDKERKPLDDAVTLIERKIERKQDEIPNLEQDKAVFERNMKITDSTLQKLRAEWNEIALTKFEYDQESVCPTCGQDIPQEKLDDARAKASNIFNADKASKLKHNQEKGRNEANNLSALKASLGKKLNEIDIAKVDIDALNVELSQAKAKLEAFDNAKAETKPDKDREKLVAARDKIQSEIDAINKNEAPKTDEIRERIAGIESLIYTLNAELNDHATNKQSKARIAELKKYEKDLSKEFEALEGQLYLTDEFVKAKAGLLTDKINSKFGMVEFRLFSEQINGGIEPTCITTLNGVPYNSLSNSERIKVGLDIINTLQQHFDFRPTVFCDNRESVSQLPDMDCQIISLVVSPEDHELRIELDCEEMAAA